MSADDRLEGVRSAEGVIRCCPVCGDPWESERFCIHADMTYGEALALRPNLTACVEAGARAAYEATRAKHTANGYKTATWEQAPAMTRHFHREHVLPIVTAVLAVVEAGE